MTPQSMDLAPKDGGWVLGLVQPDGPTERDWQTWAIVTWGDEGWRDDDGNPRQPISWVPLPDPQPKATGWAPPAGHIRIVELDESAWTDGQGKPIAAPWRWMIDIERPDGSFDTYRDCDFRVTREQAEATAARWSAKYGLPVAEVLLRAPESNVVPFKGGTSR